MDKIRMIINGKENFYTYEEFTAFWKEVYENSGIEFKDDEKEDLKRFINSELEKVKKYDGDPFGRFKHQKGNWENAHMILDKFKTIQRN